MIYIAATYNNAPDKDAHMEAILTYMGEYMAAHEDSILITPLLHHYTLKLVPNLKSDYKYWRTFSRTLLSKCDSMIVLMSEGWETSGGVKDEIECATKLNIPISYVDLHAPA